MAWTLQLLNDTTTIDLNDGTNYSALSPFSAPVPRTRTATGGANLFRDGSDIHAQVFMNRSVTFTIRINGTSQDNLISNINAIHGLLQRSVEYSANGTGSQVKLRRKWNNATNQLDFYVVQGQLQIGNEFSTIHQVNNTVIGVVSLTCEPFAYGAEETIENYVSNAGFEVKNTALSDWTESIDATGTTARDTSVKKDGDASLKLAMTDSGGSGQVVERYQVLADVDAAEVWSFQCWVRVDELTNCKVVMELDYNTGTDVEVSTTTENASSFVKLTANNNTVPGSVTQVTLRLRLEATAADATGVVYIDNVIAVLASAVPTAWASGRSITNRYDDDSQATINYIDIHDVPGDVPAQMQLKVTEGQNHTNFWLGAKHGTRQYDGLGDRAQGLIIECESEDTEADINSQANYTYHNNLVQNDTTGFAQSGTASHLQTVRRDAAGSASQDDATVFRTEWDVASPPDGQYRVLLAAKCGTTSGQAKNADSWSFGLSYSYGDFTLLSDTAPDTTSFVALTTETVSGGTLSSRDLLDLGTITIPPIKTPENMTAPTLSIKVFTRLADATDDINIDVNQVLSSYLDFIFLMPVDFGANYASKATGTDTYLIDSMSRVKGLYIIDGSDVVQSFPSNQLGRSPEIHPDGTRIYMLAKDSTAQFHDISDTFTLSLKYRPRFLHVMEA